MYRIDRTQSIERDGASIWYVVDCVPRMCLELVLGTCSPLDFEWKCCDLNLFPECSWNILVISFLTENIIGFLSLDFD